MTYGLNIYTESSTLTIDSTDRLTRLYNTYSYTGLTDSGNTVTVSVPGIINDDKWFAVSNVNTHRIDITADTVSISSAVSYISTPSSGILSVFKV